MHMRWSEMPGISTVACLRRNYRRGSGRLVLAVFAACIVAGIVVTSDLPALAAAGPEFSSSFGLFQHPEAIAVDQVSHDVYVIDRSAVADTVKRFDAVGTAADFSASQSYVHNNELTGTPSGEFNFDSAGSAAEIAVDNSGGPANGDLYVTDSNNAKVDVFGPDGSFLGEVNPSLAVPQTGGEPCGVAVDPMGNVYVAHSSGHIDRYAPTDSNPADDVFSGQLENVGEVCQVAVNSAGGVYADSWRKGPLREYESSQFGVEEPAGTEIDSTAYAVAVDPVNNDVFVDEYTQIRQFDASNTQVGLPFGVGILGESSGIGVDGSSSDVYAANGVSTKVDLFVVPVPSAPTVKNEFAANVTSESAELRSEINPRQHETKYFFRYGIDTSYLSGDVPAAPGDNLGGGSVAVAVRRELAGLAAGVKYHYQIVAENELGTTYGRDRTFTTFPAGTPFVLPDNRAWEMVSPLEKNGADIAGIFSSEEDLGSGAPMQASSDGDSVTYAAVGSFAGARGAPRGSQYLSRRGPNGWLAQNITPPLLSGSYGLIGHGTPYKAFALDLSSGLLINGDSKPVENVPLAPDMPSGYQNFYLHDFAGETFQALLNSTPPKETPEQFFMELEGASPNLSHVVFATDAALAPGMTDSGRPNLYEWANGQLQSVNVLPGGEPAPGAQVGSGFFEGHTVSDDGLRVFWSYEGTLYMHENGGVPSTRIAEDGIFRTASSDGSRVFFTDGLQLTGDSTAHGRGIGEDLYVFNSNTRKLTDITVDNNPVDGEGAVVEGVLGSSANGSYVYFVAKGSLTDGAVSGENNLYLWHEGKTQFIAALSSQDEAETGAQQGIARDWSRSLGRRTVRVAPNGEFAVFMSAASLAGYDNTDLLTGKADEEVYLYDVGSDRLSCISCNPSNERPIGSASIPAGTHFETGTGGKSLYQPHVLFEDGNLVFFETKDALVPQDTNGQLDVYEYENGHAYLISDGTSSEGSSFVDASADGSNAFFITRQQLIPQDVDTLVDLYDARENGGFPATGVSPPQCGGESCKPPLASQPVFGVPSSVALGASENSPKAKTKHKVKAKRKVKRHSRRKLRLRTGRRERTASTRAKRG